MKKRSAVASTSGGGRPPSPAGAVADDAPKSKAQHWSADEHPQEGAANAGRVKAVLTEGGEPAAASEVADQGREQQAEAEAEAAKAKQQGNNFVSEAAGWAAFLLRLVSGTEPAI